jgi:hypothetical protein
MGKPDERIQGGRDHGIFDFPIIPTVCLETGLPSVRTLERKSVDILTLGVARGRRRSL